MFSRKVCGVVCLVLAMTLVMAEARGQPALGPGKGSSRDGSPWSEVNRESPGVKPLCNRPWSSATTQR